MRVRIFLSATFSDMREERQEVIDTFRRFRNVSNLDIDLITMEDFGFASQSAIARSLELLREADAYLCLLGFMYGSLPPGESSSYTELEYRDAHERKKPIFALEKGGFVDANHIEKDPAKLAKLEELKRHAREHHLVMQYRNVDDLATALSAHLPQRLKEVFGDIGITVRNDGLVPHFQLHTNPQFTRGIESPKTLDVLSISAIGLLRDRGTIERYLERGCIIRLINVKRGSASANLIATQGRKPDLAADLDGAVRRVATYQALAQQRRWTGRIDLRELDWVSSVTIFALDAKEATAGMWVGAYTPDITVPGGEKWVVELTPQRGADALRFYDGQFESLWARAEVPAESSP